MEFLDALDGNAMLHGSMAILYAMGSKCVFSKYIDILEGLSDSFLAKAVVLFAAGFVATKNGRQSAILMAASLLILAILDQFTKPKTVATAVNAPPSADIIRDTPHEFSHF